MGFNFFIVVIVVVVVIAFTEASFPFSNACTDLLNAFISVLLVSFSSCAFFVAVIFVDVDIVVVASTELFLGKSGQ